MGAYILRRLLLMIPTLLGIMVINFVIVQTAPGGPVEQVLAQVQGQGVEATARFGGQTSDEVKDPSVDAQSTGSEIKYRGAQGVPPELVAELEKQFGFDKPLHERFWLMLTNYLTFDFGSSFYQDREVVDLMMDKLPVSVSLGLWTTLFAYLISIPLGIAKAVRDGTRFDAWTSFAVIVGYSIPSFLFALLLIVVFAGGGVFDWFPLRGLTSENFDELSTFGQVLDYLWHIALPVLAMTLGGFAVLTMLTKNSFLDQIHLHYVLTARAKGLSEKRVLYGHIFRNAMLIVIAGFPAALIEILFTGNLLIEVMFSLDGLGLLGFEAVINRDYPVMFGTLFLFTLLGLILAIIRDVMYVAIDPRIDFEGRGV